MNQLLNQVFLLRRQPDALWPLWKRLTYFFYRLALLLLASVYMGRKVLTLCLGSYLEEQFAEFIRRPEILALNILPVVLLALLFYGVTGRVWSGFLAGGGIAFGLALGNYYKLHFRDDPLRFADLFVIREAGAMATGDKYKLFVNDWILGVAACLVLGTVALLLLAPGKLPDWRRRLAVSAAAVLAAGIAAPVYLDDVRYKDIEEYTLLGQWVPTQSYISRGFFYPFLHSIRDMMDIPPEGYSQTRAKNLLSDYQDATIPADRQVNVIAIMREAYMDFSRYGVEGLDGSDYDLYHALEAESYTGDFVTNIFGGGTIDSERCFLTGSWQLGDFSGSTNSYAWYLRQQGYTVEGGHPYWRWYYNRQNVNRSMGFERYRFKNGDYETMTSSNFPEDVYLFDGIYEDFVQNKATGKPYFNFSVTVQGHGPYNTNDVGYPCRLEGDYSPECRNAITNYMYTMRQSDEALLELVERLRADPDPVVLVTFGDHLPWMGDGGEFYAEMGIDVDPMTESGFFTHYSTRYLIWANDAARELLGHDVAGEGPAVSPFYLMNLVFRQLGWEGPAYMQAMDEMMETFPVVTTNGRYVVDGALTEEIPEERQELFQEFLCLQHYWRNKFQYQE